MNWFPSIDVEGAKKFIDGAATVACMVSEKMNKQSDPASQEAQIAKWKHQAKTTLEKLTAEAKSTYTKFKAEVKKYQSMPFFPINPSAVNSLMECLTQAHNKAQEEKTKGQYSVTKLFKSVGGILNIRSTEFPEIKEAIRSCLDDLSIVFTDFHKVVLEKLTHTKENYDVANKGATLETLWDLNSELLNLQGAMRIRMLNRIEELRKTLTNYTTKKIGEMQYAFDDAMKKANKEFEKLPPGENKPEKLEELKDEQFLATIPNTLIFFKILASLLGIRSVAILNSDETEKKHGIYGHGFLAKACDNVDRDISLKVRAYSGWVRNLTPDKLPSSKENLRLEWYPSN